MRVIVAGSRTITDYNRVAQVLDDSPFDITVLIQGGARGVDKLAAEWAKNNDIPCEEISANWKKYGKKAGFMRNLEMAEHADALIAIWDGKSKGTKNMMNIAEKKNIPYLCSTD